MTMRTRTRGAIAGAALLSLPVIIAIGCSAPDSDWEARSASFASMAEADDEIVALVESAASVPTKTVLEGLGGRGITRVRPVTLRLVDLGLNGDLRSADASRTKRLHLDLFHDVALRAELTNVFAASPRALVWTGRVFGRESSVATFAIVDGTLSGQIRVGARIYEITKLPGADPNAYVTREIDANVLPPEQCVPAAGGDDASGAPATTSTPPTGAAPAAGPTVDLLVAYTGAAKTEAGSEAAIVSQIQAAVAAANAAYQNSQVALSLRLVGTTEVAYAETNDPGADLSALMSTTDGKLDELHAQRDALGADAVSLVTSKLGSSCGIGYIMTNVGASFAPYAFNVTDRSCLSNQTLAHELGHNMGATHDPANAGGGGGAFAYSYGYQVPGKFRTVMAYPCTGTSCPRIDHFSNPNVSYGGMPTGTADQDNARTLNQTAATTAAFRATKSTVNAAPSASFVASTASGVAPLAVTFDGTTSLDSDGSIASYAWTFGDGSNANGATASHTFVASGSYTVTLTVTDDAGATASATKVVVVTDAATSDAGGAMADASTTPPPSTTPDASVCRLGRTLCGNVCVRLATNERNCGACGVACGANQYCWNGRCR